MTDIKLLPLPPKQVLDLHIPSGVRLYGHSNESMQDYARANVAHATAALREQREFQAALIETLRMEIEGHRIAIQQLYDRAERLAEALRELVDLKDNVKHSFPNDYAARKPLAWDKARAALRDHDKEVDNG